MPITLENKLSNLIKEILWVSYTAGLNSVAFERNINPLDILKAYYIKKRDEISALDAYRKAKEEVTYRVKNS